MVENFKIVVLFQVKEKINKVKNKIEVVKENKIGKVILFRISVHEIVNINVPDRIVEKKDKIDKVDPFEILVIVVDRVNVFMVELLVVYHFQHLI